MAEPRRTDIGLSQAGFQGSTLRGQNDFIRRVEPEDLDEESIDLLGVVPPNYFSQRRDRSYQISAG